MRLLSPYNPGIAGIKTNYFDLGAQAAKNEYLTLGAVEQIRRVFGDN